MNWFLANFYLNGTLGWAMLSHADNSGLIFQSEAAHVSLYVAGPR